MKRIVFVLVLLAVLSLYAAPALAAGGQMVCRQWTGCDYTDMNGYVRHIGNGEVAWYYRSLGQGFVYEQPQTSAQTGWGSRSYSGEPGDLLGLRCALFNQGCR